MAVTLNQKCYILKKNNATKYKLFGGLINDERRTGVEIIKINCPALISSLIAYILAFLLTYYIFIQEFRPYTEAERATEYLEPLPEMSIYSALQLIAIIAIIYYFYIIIIIDRLQIMRKGLINSEPVLSALIIGSLIALVSYISILFIPLVVFSLLCYGFIGFYFGRKWHKLSWRWGIWLTLPLFVITVLIGGGETHGDAFILLGLFKFLGQIYLFAACIGAFIGSAKSKKEANNIKENEKANGTAIPEP